MQTLRRRFVSESLIFSNLLAHSCKIRFRSSRIRNLAEIIGTRGLLLFNSGVDRGGPNISESSSSNAADVGLRAGDRESSSLVGLLPLFALLFDDVISLLLSSAGEGVAVSIRSISSTSPAAAAVALLLQLILVVVPEWWLLLLLAALCVVLEAVVMTTSSQFCVVGNVIVPSAFGVLVVARLIRNYI